MNTTQYYILLLVILLVCVFISNMVEGYGSHGIGSDGT